MDTITFSIAAAAPTIKNGKTVKKGKAWNGGTVRLASGIPGR